MIGRKEELDFLIEKANSPKFELGIVYGQRRIGKTTILDELCKTCHAFRYQAVETYANENLVSFSRQLREYLGYDINAIYTDFDMAFRDIVAYGKKRKMTIIIDEFPYLANGNNYLLSLIQDYCDHGFKEANITLILSGSDESFMMNLLSNRSIPLYKRNTFQMEVKRLPFSDSLAFLKSFSSEDTAKFLALFSTRPYYLSMVNSEKSYEENVLSLLYSRFATLLNATDDVLPQGFSSNQAFNTILSLISNGYTHTSEIAIKMGVDSGYLSPYLKKLIEIEAIERRETFSQGKKGNYYAISDSLLAFYYRFIFSNTDYIRMGSGEALYKKQKNLIDEDFIPHGFERVCADYLMEQNIRGNLGILYTPLQNYRVENSKLGRSIEIDGIAKGLESDKDHLLVMEVKFKNRDISKSIYDHLKESVSIFRGYKVIDYYLFSKKGFSEDIKTLQDEHLHLITLDEMIIK